MTAAAFAQTRIERVPSAIRGYGYEGRGAHGSTVGHSCAFAAEAEIEGALTGAGRGRSAAGCQVK